MPRSTDSYDKLVKRYAIYGPRYDRWFGRYSDATLDAAERLVVQYARQPKALLDVACGTGLLVERLRPSFPQMRIVGVDISEDMLEQARRKFADDTRTEWHIAKAESLPFDDGTFDILTCTHAFHLFKNQDSALTEFRRVVRPGGLVVLLDWDRKYLTMKLMAVLYRLFGTHERQIHDFHGLRRCLGDAGLEIAHAESFKATPFWGMAALAAREPVPQRTRPQRQDRPRRAVQSGGSVSRHNLRP